METLWQSTVTMPRFSKLHQDLNVDVCVIGGGFSGLLTAYMLVKEGQKVCVLDSQELAAGQTGRTTAHVSNVLDDRFYQIERYHGRDKAYLAAESHGSALDMIEDIVHREGIDCEFKRVNGYLFATNTEERKRIKTELAAIERIGYFNTVEWMDHTPLPSIDTLGCLRFPRQIRLHPLKFLSGIVKCLIRDGAKIFTQTPVSNVRGGEVAIVTTRDSHRIYCKSAVVATNSPINDLFAIHTKQAPYRTYVLGFEVPKGVFPDGLFWDVRNPYHYFRIEPQDQCDLLVIGGEDHKTGQEEHPEKCFERLESWTRTHFPEAYHVRYRWSGQIMEPIDALGYMGHNPLDERNIYVITGDSGNGITHGAIGAMIISDQIMGRENPWEDLYSPSRISMRATSEFLKENANVAAQYADWFQPKPKPSLKDLKPDQGVVFREGVKMVAAYKNKAGEVELLSATCPHLAGVVRWNEVEKSWDCPCHGSRFDCHGRVIEGPAFSDLKKLETEDQKEQHKPLEVL